MIVAFFLRINMLGKNDWVTQLSNKKVELLYVKYFILLVYYLTIDLSLKNFACAN